MKTYVPSLVARGAVTFNPGRPATAILHDAPDVRLVVFRLAPGQAVAEHRSASAVVLMVVSGTGIVSGEDNGIPCEKACAAGEVVAYEPNELHAMRALDEEFVLLATITPRPGSR